MVRRGLLFSALLCALVCASVAPAATVQRPPVQWSPAGSGNNFTPSAHRTITTIVIHVTDGGSLMGNVWWLVHEKSEASAHYVVSRDGQIVQLVPLHDIAWHSGNRAVNAHSIGIEHVGDTYDPSGFPNSEYISSARLVAWLVTRYDIPIDRTHIIGHSQVPDPFHPGLFGGSDHHTDPGPHWRWGYYLGLVRKFAFPNALKVTTSITPGDTLRGVVPWSVATKGGTASHVDFAIDGRVVWSDSRAPFAFQGGHGWNTTQVPNGTHVLTIRASGKDGHAATRLVVRVANHEFALTTSALRPWQVLKGVFHVRATAWGAKAPGVWLYVDGKVMSRDMRAPYSLRFDTRRVKDGAHALVLIAKSVDGRTARRSLTVVIRNHVAAAKPAPRPKPKPKPLPAPQITAENIADGQTVSGVVDWRAHIIGAVSKVEFVVDGTVIATVTGEPWAAQWTSTAGTHVLEVRAYTRDGQQATRDVTVTVAPPQ